MAQQIHKKRSKRQEDALEALEDALRTDRARGGNRHSVAVREAAAAFLEILEGELNWHG